MKRTMLIGAAVAGLALALATPAYAQEMPRREG